MALVCGRFQIIFCLLYTCICISHTKAEECTRMFCNNHGTCIETYTKIGRLCFCDPGYYGVQCQNYEGCLDPRLSCNNHGDCITRVQDGSIKCFCDSGYHGDRCQFSYTGFCTGSAYILDEECNYHGVCDAERCKCNYGYSGMQCEICTIPEICRDDAEHTTTSTEEPVDFCSDELLPCNGHGGCINYECDCYYDYYGDRCQYSQTEEKCSDYWLPCNSHGICSTHRNGGIDCYCDSGYHGDRCQFFGTGGYDMETAIKKSNDIKRIALSIIYTVVCIVVLITIIVARSMVRSTWDGNCMRLEDPERHWRTTRDRFRDPSQGGLGRPTIQHTFREFPTGGEQSEGRGTSVPEIQSHDSEATNHDTDVEGYVRQGTNLYHVRLTASQLSEEPTIIIEPDNDRISPSQLSEEPMVIEPPSDLPPSYAEVTGPHIQDEGSPSSQDGQHSPPVAVGDSGELADQMGTIDSNVEDLLPPPTYETATRFRTDLNMVDPPSSPRSETVGGFTTDSNVAESPVTSTCETTTALTSDSNIIDSPSSPRFETAGGFTTDSNVAESPVTLTCETPTALTSDLNMTDLPSSPRSEIDNQFTTDSNMVEPPLQPTHGLTDSNISDYPTSPTSETGENFV